MAFSSKVSTLPIGTRTIQKVRIRILSFVFLLFVIAILDRVNIGFAALTMNKELGITSQQFGLLAGIFFLG
jgi:MFS transporter, ACS family, tartrate transporter